MVLDAVAARPMRHAVEVRHRSFANAEFVQMLRRHGVALVIADTAGRYPQLFDLTADFVYLRLHGATELYRSGYRDAELATWAARIEAWRAGHSALDDSLLSAEASPAARPEAIGAPQPIGRDIYCYFDNTAEMHAPADARRLAERLGVSPPDLPPLWAAMNQTAQPGAEASGQDEG